MQNKTSFLFFLWEKKNVEKIWETISMMWLRMDYEAGDCAAECSNDVQ